jgi:hypothetical protein
VSFHYKSISCQYALEVIFGHIDTYGRVAAYLFATEADKRSSPASVKTFAARASCVATPFATTPFPIIPATPTPIPFASPNSGNAFMPVFKS